MADPTRPEPPPLTDEQLALLRGAVAAYRPVRRAAKLARTSGIITLCIALPCTPLAMVSLDIVSVLVLAALIAAGVVEYIGHRRLLRVDLAAPRLLALNQLAVFAAITVYCIVKMLTIDLSLLDQVAIPADSQKQINDILGNAAGPQSVGLSMKSLLTVVVVVIYSLIIAVSAIYQGVMALYYITRRKALRRFDDLRPDWPKALVIDMHR